MLNNPIDVINEIKRVLSEVIEENNLEYLNFNIEDLFIIYSINLCDILLNYYPGATIVLKKDYNICGVLIQGCVYTSKGIENINDFSIADSEEINFIKKNFNKLSDYVMSLMKEKLENNYNNSYLLRNYNK